MHGEFGKNLVRHVRSPDYNYVFNTRTGAFARWGQTEADDPDFSPFGPEILDMEISTVCQQGCTFCYKSNVAEGKNMGLETFKEIFHKFPRNLTQIAFGIGSLGACPDMYPIMRYCRENDYNKVVPNLTINGASLTDTHVGELASVVGAVAVSRYNPNVCYDAVKKLTDAGIEQVNIHQLLCEETYDACFDAMRDSQTDPRLSKLRAIVFLLMKPKGDRNVYTQLSDPERYGKLIDHALDNGIPIGFDSCSAPSFLRAVRDRPEYARLAMAAEPCESDCFSSYVNVEGRYFHCSFTEGEDGWEGIDMLGVDDFMKDIWNAPEVQRFRSKLMDSQRKNGCRECPVFDLNMGETDEGKKRIREQQLIQLVRGGPEGGGL